MNNKEKNNIIHIYGLYDSSDINKTIRYIGQTKHIKKRIRDHQKLHLTTYNSYKKSWIKNVLTSGNKIEHIILEKCTLENWSEREKYWIKFYKLKGNKLTNHTLGGDGNKLYSITYEECREWVKNNFPHINSIKLWQENLHNLPEYIPHAPRVVFIENGWISWIDFLNSPNIFPNSLTKEYLNYEDAKKFVQINFPNIKSSRQWKKCVQKNLIPKTIPNMPQRFYRYKNRGWKGWGDFLRTGLVERSVIADKYLSISGFINWVNKNLKKLMNGKDWKDNYVDKNKIPYFIPKNPKQYYGAKKQWVGWKKILPNFKYATTYTKIMNEYNK